MTGCAKLGIIFWVMIKTLVAIAIELCGRHRTVVAERSARSRCTPSASLMAIWAPLFAYEPAAEAGQPRTGNSGWSFERSAQRQRARSRIGTPDGRIPARACCSR